MTTINDTTTTTNNNTNNSNKNSSNITINRCIRPAAEASPRSSTGNDDCIND